MTNPQLTPEQVTDQIKNAFVLLNAPIWAKNEDKGGVPNGTFFYGYNANGTLSSQPLTQDELFTKLDLAVANDHSAAATHAGKEAWVKSFKEFVVDARVKPLLHFDFNAALITDVTAAKGGARGERHAPGRPRVSAR